MLGNILVGRYQIISRLGGGGFGETFVAFDTQLPGEPKCVVKQLKPQFTDPMALQTARRLFDTEAQVLYKLGNNEHIPQLLAFFTENQEFYLVQEFISGHDLSKELVPGQKFNQKEVINLITEILKILEFVHQQNVIHRDINPRNILRRDGDGKLILIDFGAVKEITTQAIANSGQVKQTVCIGTPGYIPSEQAQGIPKFNSDIYAVGIIGIQALTGLVPSQFNQDVDTHEFVWREEAEVSPDFADILDKMVRYDFRERYNCATQVLAHLQNLHSNQSHTIPVSTGLIQANNIAFKPKKIFIQGLVVFALLGFAGIGSALFINHINSNNADSLYQKANILADLQKHEEAIKSYNQAIQLKPNYSAAWYGKGKSLSALKQDKQALVAYDKAIEIQPNYFDAWYGRGLTLDKLKRYQEAVTAFDKALEIQNKNPDVWVAKGQVLINLKNYDEAIATYEQAIKLQPDNSLSWYQKGIALHQSQRYEDAIASFDRSLEIKSNYPSVWYQRGNSLAKLRRYEDAIKSYDQAVEYQNNYEPAWLSKGNILLILQKYPEAIAAFTQATKSNSRNYNGWYNLGQSLHQAQRYTEAISAFEQAINIKPSHYQSWYGKGNALYQLNQYQAAIQSYDRVISQQKNHAESWYSRGNAFFNLQQYPQAIASYKQAIKYKPGYQPAEQALQQAEKLLAKQGNG